jgi:predicted transcriptional regulator
MALKVKNNKTKKTKEKNNVLQAVNRLQPVSKPGIMSATGYGVHRISRILKALRMSGAIKERRIHGKVTWVTNEKNN